MRGLPGFAPTRMKKCFSEEELPGVVPEVLIGGRRAPLSNFSGQFVRVGLAGASVKGGSYRMNGHAVGISGSLSLGVPRRQTLVYAWVSKKDDLEHKARLGPLLCLQRLAF